MPKSLRDRLNKALEDCDSEVQFTIPHVFLPPRFKEISNNRNMILFLDIDQVVHVRWEGARFEEHHPLTPGACRRLFKDCVANMKRYRKDLDSIARFIDREAQAPFWNPRENSLTGDRQDKPASAEEVKEKGDEIIAVLDNSRELDQESVSNLLELGGESPMPFGW